MAIRIFLTVQNHAVFYRGDMLSSLAKWLEVSNAEMDSACSVAWEGVLFYLFSALAYYCCNLPTL